MRQPQKKSPTKSARKGAASAQTLPQDFSSVARRLGVDEDKERFEAKLGKLAKTKPRGDQK
jgi:hypothetical protein